jgi:O-antigen/teichoic acid export membrane protein
MIIDNIGWLFLDKILRMGVGLFLGVWIARYLGPEQFGLLNFAIALLGFFGAIAGLGLQGIAVREIVRDPVTARLTLGTTTILQLIGGLVAYLLLLGTIAFLRPEDVLSRTIVAILGITMLFKASEMAIYWFESQVQSKYTAWVQNSIFLVFAVVKAGLILSHASLIAFVWAMLVEAILVAIILMVVVDLRGPKLTSLSASTDRAITLLRDGLPLILSSLSVMLYMKIDQIMLGIMIGDEAVGIYSAATRISEAWYFLPIIIVASVFPAILESKKCNETQYTIRLQKLYDFMVILSLAVSIPMTFLSNYIITLLFGAAYAQAGTILAIHIWGSIFVFLGIAGSRWFLAENMLWLNFQRTAIGATANIALNLVLIPKYGGIGAAVALVISQALSSWLYDYVNLITRQMFVMKFKALNLYSVFIRYKVKISL